MVPIPARSPDLNPIENIFHTVRKALKENAIAGRIEKESYEQFCRRVAVTITSLSGDYIRKTIDSMPKRIGAVIKQKGARTKY